MTYGYMQFQIKAWNDPIWFLCLLNISGVPSRVVESELQEVGGFGSPVESFFYIALLI